MPARDSDLDYFKRLKERLPLNHLASVEDLMATLLFWLLIIQLRGDNRSRWWRAPFKLNLYAIYTVPSHNLHKAV